MGGWAPRGRWWTRLWSSWVALVVVLISLGGAGAGMISWLEGQASTHAQSGALGAGELISFATVGGALPSGTGTPGSADLNVATLTRSASALSAVKVIYGLTVWSPLGTVAYHRGLAGPSAYASPAFQKAIAGSSQVRFFTPAVASHEAMVEVLMPAGTPIRGKAPYVVAVIIPASLIADLTTWATVKLLLAVIAIVMSAAAGLFAMRRRLRRRTYEAHHDHMTGLGNRMLLEASGGSVDQGGAALLLMDLDGFKRVNDHLGHSAGDQLLVAVASALRAVVRPRDLLVRIGGDEFAVLAEGVDEASATAMAERLLSAVRAPFTVGAVSIEVDASVGVAIGPRDGATTGDLLSAADIAMYRAKHGRLGVCSFAEVGEDHSAHDLRLLSELRQAISAGELELHYQPGVAIQPGTSSFVEALVRWHHPERGLVPPMEFIPLAEETAFIHPLTEWILNEAVRQCAAWYADGIETRVAVNVSPRSLSGPDFVEIVRAALLRHRLPAAALHVEITESAIIARPETARAVLEELRSIGVSVSIDDFGTGFTSLVHLKQLPVEVLKIDRMFVMDLLRDERDAAIVSSVIELGHSLGMIVVAEGVEDQATLERLVALGCDLAQGFHLSRPQPAAEATRWLRAQNARVMGALSL